jgi:hypothetical protein
MDLTPEVWLLSAAAVLFASIVMSLAGFGFGLVVTPLLILFLDSKLVITLSAFLSAVICLPIVWQSRKQFQPKQTLIMLISCLIGLPIGLYILSVIPVPALKLLISSLVVVFAVLLVLGISHRLKRENAGLSLSAFAGGILMACAGLGGPPVVLYLLNQGYQKRRFYFTSAQYYLISGLAAFALLGLTGEIKGSAMLNACTFIPVVAIGYILGTVLHNRIDPTLFRKIALSVIILAALAGIISTLASR